MFAKIIDQIIYTIFKYMKYIFISFRIIELTELNVK